MLLIIKAEKNLQNFMVVNIFINLAYVIWEM